MFDVFGFILTFFNAILFYLFMLFSLMWITEHAGKISCYLIPPILLIISFCLCLISIIVYNNFLFNVLSPC